MKRRSSNCFRVSISLVPPQDSFETNHEHTLSVPYVFRNPFNLRKPERNLDGEPKNATSTAGLRRWGVGVANQQAVRSSERGEHGAVLHAGRGRDRHPRRIGGEAGAQIIGALVISRQV